MKVTQESSRKIPEPLKDPLREEQNPAGSVTLLKPIQTLTFYRIWQILGNKKAKPPVEPLLPISRSAFYAGIKKKIYPDPVKLSPRISAWRSEDVRELLERFNH